MKKLVVFASVLAMASLCLVSAPTLRAQDSGTISIKDPQEYNAYTMANSQSDPKQKAAALESFLATYPQSQVKQSVLDTLVDLYEAAPPAGAADPSKELVADDKLLQLAPNNLKALLYSVIVKKQMSHGDVPTLDDAAARANKGLTVPKPASISDDEWKKLTAAAYPLFHSAIATDDVAKKDFKGAIEEYKAELMLYTPDQTQSGPGLVDTLNLAEAYVNVNPKKPDPKDVINAVWFYSRAWDFAPAAYKGPIEKKVEYWYKNYHGGLDGLDAIKTQAQSTVFPAGLTIAPAKTPAEKIHDLLQDPGTDLSKMALSDIETILAVGSKEDADKAWAVLKDKVTPVPGIVVESTASVVKVAVTKDAQDAKTADFIVNMKTPLTDKEIPAVGFELKADGTQLAGTYDTYTQTPATDTTAASAQIVLRDGLIQTAKKAPVHKPAAAHHAAAHATH